MNSQEIRTKWEAYRKTGLQGFRQQVIDRLVAGGISTINASWTDEALDAYIRDWVR